MATQQDDEITYKITYEPTIQEEINAILEDIKRFIGFLRSCVV